MKRRYLRLEPKLWESHTLKTFNTAFCGQQFDGKFNPPIGSTIVPCQNCYEAIGQSNWGTINLVKFWVRIPEGQNHERAVLRLREFMRDELNWDVERSYVDSYRNGEQIEKFDRSRLEPLE